MSQSVALIFGAGWMGTQLAEHLQGSVLTQTNIADERAVAEELEHIAPTHVVNAAGKTGRPNVDSLESEPRSTYRSNVVGAIELASACHERGIHFTHLGSGCIYSGDNLGRGFAEEDAPNFFGSLYSRTKALAEAALRDLGALQLRVRLPISEVPGPRNLLTKLLSFSEVVSVPNSITVLEDFWPSARALIEANETGVWNMVNDGVETHDELLALFCELVNPCHAFKAISPEALEPKLVAKRSNCVLSTAKLHTRGLALPDLRESLPRLVKAYGLNLGAAETWGP